MICSQTTYEELKQPTAVSFNAASILLPDYLWGIETLLAKTFQWWEQSSQTTYEELKPAPASMMEVDVPLPDYLWGIETCTLPMAVLHAPGSQTTYEELKHGSRMESQVQNNGSQTTYEELKLFRGFWNRQLSASLPDYLWGIETTMSNGSR